jgi:hypothetical protein
MTKRISAPGLVLSRRLHESIDVYDAAGELIGTIVVDVLRTDKVKLRCVFGAAFKLLRGELVAAPVTEAVDEGSVTHGQLA